MTKSLCAWTCALALLNGCVDDRDRGDDAGHVLPGEDGGTYVPPPPPGGLTLGIEGSEWLSEGGGRAELSIALRLANGTAGDPAPLDPMRFSVRTSGGAEALGVRGGASGPCGADLAVGPGGSVGCSAVFSIPSAETPVELIYRSPDDREARAAIDACSASRPSGLCASGQTCRAGRCETECSFDHPEGTCASDADVCLDGECLPRCSATEPTGHCEVGVCREGTCDTSCQSIALSDACLNCASNAIDVGTCPFRDTCDSYCAYCPAKGGDTCTCVTDPGCPASDCGDLSAFYSCIAAACPACAP